MSPSGIPLITVETEFSRLEGLPEISNAHAALQAMIDFFKERQLLMREDFLRLVRQSQLWRSG